MNIKTIITVLLLLFVGISLAYVVIGESRQDNNPAEIPTEPTIKKTRDETVPSKLEEPQQTEEQIEPTAEVPLEVAKNDEATRKPQELKHKVVAYYFHGTQRCVTCRTIEAYTEESLSTAFSRELETGMLEWRPVNVDNPGNGHFIQDFELSTRSVVLVEMLDGEQNRWKNLARVWELVRDKPTFTTYIQEEVRAFLGD